MSIADIYILILSFFKGCDQGRPKYQKQQDVVSLKYLKKQLRNEIDVFHADKHENFSQVASMIFVGFGQTCLNYPGKIAKSLLHLKKEDRSEVRDLTVLAGSNNTLTIYYTSNVPPPLALLLSLNMESMPSYFFI